VPTSTCLLISAAPCPACGAEVRLMGRQMIGEVLGCAACGAPLEIAGNAPAALEPLARVESEEEELEARR